MFNSSPQHYSHPACRLLELQLTFCNFSCCSWLCSTRTQILCSTRTQILCSTRTQTLCNFPPWVFKLLRVFDGVYPRLVTNCWQTACLRKLPKIQPLWMWPSNVRNQRFSQLETCFRYKLQLIRTSRDGLKIVFHNSVINSFGFWFQSMHCNDVAVIHSKS